MRPSDVTATEPTHGLREPLSTDERSLTTRIGSWDRPALLMGGASFGIPGRWSFLAANPRLVFEAVSGSWTLRDQFAIRAQGNDPFWGLQQALAIGTPPRQPLEVSHLPPFQGGWIGHLGYDLAPCIEVLPRKAMRDSRIADIRLSLYDTFVAIDHLENRADLWSFDLRHEGTEALRDRMALWRDRLENSPEPPLLPSRGGPLTSGFDRSGYLSAVQAVRDYIAAGDVFQINLSQRFASEGDFDPLDLFLRLRRRSPAPFSAFLRWDDLAVVSASPEWFYRTEGARIVTRPIKGTRPRGQNPSHDAALARELLASEKDRAELTMIVDLERNDLGRVCQFGSVNVSQPCGLETYAQVHHLVATVQGLLRPGTSPADVLRALFPGGSITGAPKIRAMQIIDELEPVRRSLYTGAIGYISSHGDSAFNIAIRTMLVEGQRASFGVGGGIVIDSEPALEYEETLHKGRGLREVIEGWGLQG
ncbi:MAG TPA: aminodeoxychorismate synthase component I [Isosphaeraceae bacterium]|nr:aminodeoxychorismate synthase component I [Isosphaeraceae bacterium]